MRVKIIINPYANRWRAQKRIPAIQKAFDEVDVEHVIVITSSPGQATEEARLAVEQGFDAVVAAGGDGTVNEIVNGLVPAAGDGPTVPLAVLPIGTGNDLSEMLGNPTDPAGVARMVSNRKTRQLDLGRVNDHYFANNCAVAMEPMITIENVKIKRLKGKARYMAALAIGLLKLKAWDMDITWDDGGYKGPTILLSVCNGPRTGGQFMMAPDAQVDDGLFDFVLLPNVSKMTVLRLLPKLFGGTHVLAPQVTYHRTRVLTLTSEPGTAIHADGEVLTTSTHAVRYEIMPGKLTFLIP
ncbi:MAG: diacylglycerol kinase family lipid kinase [Anaerolineae bacterium]|nr:diacylglycerol kinase family lipid kinase [Anaerolineae bacterium]MCO5206712.1 diacylglycerol kinase family lipid kinase [Anaerolineae bacterium]